VRKIFRVVLCALCFGLTAAKASEPVLTVFAAASLTDVLQQVGDAYTAGSGQTVRFSFAATSALARQIESGAPADVFVSADQDWMDYLQTRQLIQAATRADVVTNTLVLVAAADSTLRLTIAPGFALATALGPTGRLSLGDPASVPAGKYAQAALTQLGVWPAITRRIVAADNVRTALNFVARGEAPLGIVYGTDALAEPKVRVVAVFPAGSHPPIRYPAALTRNAVAGAAGFLRFLQSDKARAIFAKAGFAKP
jgi:molybdate transport system substrate-binding protein